MKYIVPEYYKDFKCKCGSCRHSCCEGWPIRISMKEYYRLLGINCSKKLRAKLDRALKICPEPSSSCYAEISHDWEGICLMHREDGLCSLHTELGENNLPEICRIYPRKAVHLSDNYECSCSNSCEEVVELLMGLKKPLLFEENDLPIHPKFEMKVPMLKYEACKNSISIIQDRSLSLPERFLVLGNHLAGNDVANDVSSIVANDVAISSSNNHYAKSSTDLSLAFQYLFTMDKFYESSISISDYCRSAQNYFSMDNKENLSEEDVNLINERYIAAANHLEALLPDWQVIFEQLLVNHMFYRTFPFTEGLANKDDAFLSLVAIYSFLRINLLGFMSDKSDLNQLVDFFAAMFRLIDHSDFDLIAVKLLKSMKYSATDYVPQLLNI